ncbi:MAG: hypothetical protein NT167_27055 [Verrucomicrobia bacterium]|nr:hypothetical protein [Verrucomicrobiota bacterium]
MKLCKSRFVLDQEALQALLLTLKLLRCPHCDCLEFLNRHSLLYGNNPKIPGDDSHVRGQRVFCSNRGQRGGCGRTFAVFLADVLPRFTVTATLLWQLLLKLLCGNASLPSAKRALGSVFHIQTLYHLLVRLRGRLDAVRVCLCDRVAPPASSQTDPLLQTVEHFQAAFPHAACPLRQFQVEFHTPLFG